MEKVTKHKILKWCNIVSVILIVCFIVKTIFDYKNYSTTLNSAPFSIWILVNAIYFVVPALIVFLVGIVLKKRR